MKKSFQPSSTLMNGSFGLRSIPFRFNFRGKRGLIVFFHGLASSPFGSSTTNHSWLYDFFQKKGYSVAMFESSRNNSSLAPKNNFEALKHYLFSGKTLLDEVEDAKTFLTFILKEEKKIGILRKSLPLHFVGFSMGGIVASILSDTFQPKSISLFGSSLGFTLAPDTPILGTSVFPLNEFKKEIHPFVKKYSGNICLVRGTEDDTAPLQGSEELFSLFADAQLKSFIHLKGVNHRFRTKLGEIDESLLRKISVILNEHFLVQ